MRQLMSTITCLIALIFIQCQSAYNNKQREVLNMNQDWEFGIQVSNGMDTPSLEGAQTIEWQGVHLPHTPRVEPKEFSTHWQGICWYKKKFKSQKDWQGKRIIIKFEAVMQQADVWVNGQKLTQHLGGFLPFSIDVTNFISYDDTINELLVRADNRDNPDIPPGKNLTGLDMTYQGGIYRSVNMIITDKLCVSDAVNANKVAGGGVFVSYPYVSDELAEVQVKTHIINQHPDDKECWIQQRVIDKDGNIVSQNTSKQQIVNANSDKQTVQKITIEHPSLWHPNSPERYTLVTTILERGKVIDELRTKIGIRQIEWKTDGFYINGKRLLLYGANRHQDGIYVGNALPESVQRLDAKKLREAGFNNVRAGHYPLDPAFMDACDEYGLTVIACIPGWHWYKESEAFKENSYQDLRDLIRRDRNHPSVVLYETILNETRYTAEYARRTHEISKEEYPACFVACDFDYPEHRIYDVNYKVPDASLPSFTREWGDDNRYCGIHKNKEGFTWGDWANRDDEHSMVYQSLARQKDLNGDGYWDWYGVNANPNMAGYALWVGFDHNRGATNNIARCGVWGLDRYPKFCHYFLQSQRNPNIKLNDLDSGPMVFIGSYWRESSIKDVNVYSNCEKVRLSLNGHVIAEQKADQYYNEGRGDQNLDHVDYPVFTFKQLNWEAGTLVAEGIIGDEVVATHKVKTPGKATQLSIEMDHLTNQLLADGSDMAMIYVKAVDENGTLVPDFKGRVNVGIKGQGRLVGANPVSLEGGVAAIWLRSTVRAGSVELMASCNGLASAEMQVQTTPSNQKVVPSVYKAEPKSIRSVEAAISSKESSNLEKVKDFNLSVSSTKEGYSPNQLYDGDNESWWFAADNKKQWITIELKKTESLSGSLIVWEKDSNWYQFRILTSADGIQWKEVYKDSQTGHNFELEQWDSHNTKWVKIELDSVEPGNALMGIREISIFAK
ncbi:MAG: discoidin domain-containing protein [Carboxylicivirga sp.]|nr:discoidin domain-containing protein [Carboxylicivirga sp.]